MDEIPAWRWILHRDLWASIASSKPAEAPRDLHHRFAPGAQSAPAAVNIIQRRRLIMFVVRRTQVSGTSRYAARPFSQSRPLKGVTDIDSMVPLSMQRALTLTPSGCERGM